MSIHPQENQEIDELFKKLDCFFETIFNGKEMTLGVLNTYYCLVYSCFEDVSYSGDYGIEKLEMVLKYYLINKTQELSKVDMKEIPMKLKEIFGQWKVIRKTILFVFGTLDFCPHQRVNATIKSVLKHSFKNDFFEYLIKEIKLFDVLIAVISQGRFEKDFSFEQSESILSILEFHFDEQLAFYLQSFQKQLEEQTLIDYKKFIAEIEQKPIGECLELLDSFIEREHALIQTAFLPNMQTSLVEMLKNEVLLKMTKRMLEEFPGLLKTHHIKEVFTISQLWNGTKELNTFLNPIDSYFMESFNGELDQEWKRDTFKNDLKSIINFIFKFKNLAEELRNEYFRGNSIFGECVTNSFKSCLTKNKITEIGDEKQTDVLLATYVHSVMTDKETEENTMKKLSNVLDVVYYLSNKELFISLHQKLLLKRIIQNTMKSVVLESSVVNDICKNFSCSASFKLKRILNDYSLSKDITKEFCSNRKMPLKFNIIIFSKFLFASNDIYCSTEMEDELKNIWDQFVDSYKSVHSDRKLELNQLCCSVTLLYDNGIKKSTLEISFIQYRIMLKLKEKGELTIKELHQEIAPQVDSFKFHLGGLITSGILSSTNGIEGSSIIWFTNNSVDDGFLLNKIDKKLEGKKKDKQTNKEDESRKFTAIICFQVKIMKQRKDFSYQDLIQETLSNLNKSFEVDVKLAKQGIEYLIEKEYISRDEEDNGLFHYIA